METLVAAARNIVLIGMPGSGKSTIGSLLARELAMPFIDTDLVLETREGRSLQQILDERGVSAFLALEESLLLSLNLAGHVVSTGGSAVYSPRAMGHLGKRGVVVFLDASLPVLRKRILNMGNRGIVLAPGRTLDDLYAERKPLYERYADLRISCDQDGPQKVLRKLLQELEGWSVPSKTA
jgi:shikimate kinase